MTAISCPVCTAPFREVIRDGILIDVCTQCQGVWLDRGELEKLLASAHHPYVPPPRQHTHAPHYDDDYRRHGYSRKKSKLETIFDIFD